VIEMTRPKVIAITLLAVLLALGSASLFVQNGSSQPTALTLRLTPTSGCPGTLIDVYFTGEPNGALGSVTASQIELTSYPVGLISILTENGFTVGDSVCAGDYVVTAKLRGVFSGVGNAQTQILEVSTHFTVGGDGCLRLRRCLQPVGGVVMPTNTLAIAAPYLALAGLIVAVSAVVVVKRRRD